MDLAGGKTVGGRGTGAEQLAQQLFCRQGPGGAAISSGRLGRPLPLLTPPTSAQVVVVELVTTTGREAQLLGHRGDRQPVAAQLRQQVADEGSSVSVD